MIIDSEKIIKCFELSLTQYLTIDKLKHESFGASIQGLFFYKRDGQSYIMPFQFSDEKTKQEVIDSLKTIVANHIGFSFVQHYIHYGY